MKIADIKGIAKQYGVKAGKLKKGDLIKEIQKAEGNFDCFGSASEGFCDQQGCLWHADCMKAA